MVARLWFVLGVMAQVSCAQAARPALNVSSLRTFLKITPDEWRTVEAGAVVVKTLERSDKREVAVAGLTRTTGNASCFLTAFADIEGFKRGQGIARVQSLSQPPRLDDLKDLIWSDAEVEDLRRCRAGDCRARLPPGVMEKLGTIQDGPDFKARFQILFREHLLRNIQDYLARGNVALLDYRDSSKPVILSREFRELLDAAPGLRELAPDFHGYMSRYPQQKPTGVKDFLYWSIEEFGLRPVISVTHVFIYEQPGYALVATKQIYANHYFDGSLGLTLLMNAPAGERSGLYLAYVNRSRIDLLGGFLGGFRRWIMRSRLLEEFEKHLAETRRRINLACSAKP